MTGLCIIGAATALLSCGGERGRTKNVGSVSGLAAVNGTRLSYEVKGEGRPLVLIHGGLVDQRMWDDQFEAFARTYRVVRYDIRGYGKSGPATVPFSHIEDLRGLLKFLGVRKTIVIGLSLGGQIAIDFTLEHPGLVEALIPVSSSLTGFPFELSEDFIAQYQAVLKMGGEGRLDEAVEALLKMSFFIPYDPGSDIQERMRPMLRDNFAPWTSAAVTGLYQWPEPQAYQRIEKIGVPTLIVVGREDTQAILDCAEDMAKRIPGARKVVIPDAAHHLNMEKPAEFNRVVLDFLGRL